MEHVIGIALYSVGLIALALVLVATLVRAGAVQLLRAAYDGFCDWRSSRKKPAVATYGAELLPGALSKMRRMDDAPELERVVTNPLEVHEESWVQRIIAAEQTFRDAMDAVYAKLTDPLDSRALAMLAVTLESTQELDVRALRAELAREDATHQLAHALLVAV